MSEVHSTEVWKDVEGFAGYQVSSLGRLRSRRPRNGRGGLAGDWRMVPGNKSRRGYWRVVLCDGGRVVAARVHRLVLEAFAGACPEGMEACHNDGNPDNNRADNLRWDTKRGNALDRGRHGTQACGEAHPSAKLTEQDVLEIRAARRSGMHAKHLAVLFGVQDDTVLRVCHGRNWRSVAQNVPYLRFSPEKLVREVLRANLSQAEVARRSGIDHGFLSQLRHGKKQASWRTVHKLAEGLGVPPDALCDYHPG